MTNTHLIIWLIAASLVIVAVQIEKYHKKRKGKLKCRLLKTLRLKYSIEYNKFDNIIYVQEYWNGLPEVLFSEVKTSDEVRKEAISFLQKRILTEYKHHGVRRNKNQKLW